VILLFNDLALSFKQFRAWKVLEIDTGDMLKPRLSKDRRHIKLAARH